MFEFLYRSRTRVNTLAIGVLLAIAASRRFVPDSVERAVTIIGAVAIGIFVFGIIVSLVGNRRLPVVNAVTVASPVSGRWLAMNSPATKVPSHGTRAYGQTYAIDLVFESSDGDSATRPEFASGPAFRPATDYPAFGKPVMAMVSGTVVRVSNGQRDHRARARLWTLFYLSFEGLVRDIGGARFVIGNHVVIRTAEGYYALVAHLQRGSVRVKKGDYVDSGQVVGLCGNSGNSSEPHVHAQVMDRPSPSRALGVPFVFAGIQVESDGAVTSTPNLAGQVPANGEHLLANP